MKVRTVTNYHCISNVFSTELSEALPRPRPREVQANQDKLVRLTTEVWLVILGKNKKSDNELLGRTLPWTYFGSYLV